MGAKPENGDLVKHVLGRFSKEDDAKIRDVFALAEEGLLAILQEDVKTAMNAVNGKKVGEFYYLQSGISETGDTRFLYSSERWYYCEDS